MTLSFHLELAEDQITGLEALVASAQNPVRRRAEALLLLFQGHLLARVAEQVGVTVTTLRRWVERFQAQGLAGLQDGPKSGRPRKATDPYRQRLESVLAHHPGELGYDCTGIPSLLSDWTITRLRAHMERETGICVSAGRLRILLHEMGYTYRRTVRNPTRFPPLPPNLRGLDRLAGDDARCPDYVHVGATNGSVIVVSFQAATGVMRLLSSSG